MQGAPVDGPFDDLADPVGAPVGFLCGLAQFAVGWLLVRGDHSSSHVPLVGDPPGGVDSAERSGRRPGRPRHAWGPDRGRMPTRSSFKQDQGLVRSCRSSRAHRDRSRRLRQFQQGKRVLSTM